MAKVRPFGDMARSLAENGTEVWKYMARAERPLLAFHEAAPPVVVAGSRRRALGFVDLKEVGALERAGQVPGPPKPELVTRPFEYANGPQ